MEQSDKNNEDFERDQTTDTGYATAHLDLTDPNADENYELNSITKATYKRQRTLTEKGFEYNYCLKLKEVELASNNFDSSCHEFQTFLAATCDKQQIRDELQKLCVHGEY